jgi:transposase
LQRLRVGRRCGKPATFEVFVKNHAIKRGDQDKGGIDWWRLNDKYIQPLLKPWIDKLQQKEDYQQTTRTHDGKVCLVADNAAAHLSKHTRRILSLLDISRIAWPPQSPDLNPIEHCWDYIRAQIKKRKHCPTTDDEVIQAWEEEWAKIPQEKINGWIDALENQLRKVLACDGNNCFHG